VVQGFSDDVRCGFITRTAESTTNFTGLRGLAQTALWQWKKKCSGGIPAVGIVTDRKSHAFQKTARR